ncbi:MAG: murein biosynthesis integral membrane protein MurJ [Acidimicrobiales bacterium]
MSDRDDAISARRASGKSATLVGSGVVLSRLSGLIREVVLAGLLGTRVAADAFKAALQIPGLLQNVLGEGAMSASFVPVYADLVEQEESGKRRDEKADDTADALAGTIAALLGIVTAIVVFLGILLARPLTKIILPFLAEDTFELTVDLVRIMWAGLGFIVLSAWCLGVLNTHRRFFLSYFAPVMWNGTQVVLALFAWGRGWSDADIARAAAWGVAIGGLLQFLIQLPTVRKVAPGIRLALKIHMRSVRDVIGRFGPAVLGRGVLQISAFLDLFLAGLLAVGAITGLALAQILYLLPIGVFAMSIASADLPEMSREQHSAPRVAARMRTGHERIAFYVLFSAVAYIAMGKPIVGALFERGQFTSDDTIFVWLILAAYSLGLTASAASRLFQNASFAAGDVSGPAKLAGLRVTIAAIIGFILMLQFERFGIVDGSIEKLGDIPAFDLLPESVRENDDAPQRLGAVGLALGSAVAAWVEYGLLRRLVRRDLNSTRRYRDPAVSLLPAGVVAFLVGGALAFGLDGLHPLIVAPIAVGVGGIAYVAVAYWRGSPSAIELLATTRILR